MLLICPVQGWQIVYSVLEKNPCALLLNRSTLHSGHLFIVSHCRHLAIFIASSPVLPRHPPPKFKRPPRLSPRWFAIPHLAGQQSEQAEILFITLQNSEHIQRKCPTVTVLNLRFLGSPEVGKLGSVDGTATVCQLQRWGASSKLAPGERWRSQTLTRSVHHQAEEKQGRSCVKNSSY